MSRDSFGLEFKKRVMHHNYSSIALGVVQMGHLYIDHKQSRPQSRRKKMSRPIWHGNISFGLVNLPVNLYSIERKSEQVHFHLLDKHNHARVQNQRINKMTGKVVSWSDIEKAYEFEKGKYIAVDEKMLEKTAANQYETVEVTDFISQSEIDPIYFDKPYYLVPSESGMKGYLLLYETLKKTKKIGIATVVIKTRAHLAAILPINNLLAMITLRYAADLRDVKEFELVSPASSRKIKLSQKELELAEQLVKSMTVKWNPKKYHDDNRELLTKLIQENIKKGKAITAKSTSSSKVEEEADNSKNGKKVRKSGEVVDFMSLLKKSLADKDKKHPHGKGEKDRHHTKKNPSIRSHKKHA